MTKTTASSLLIGGLPAARFIGRSIKIKNGPSDLCACKVVSLDERKGEIIVLRRDSTGTFSSRVKPADCRPWWVQNPALQKEAEALGLTFNGEVSVGRAFAELGELGLLTPNRPDASRPLPPPAPMTPPPAPMTPSPLKTPVPAAAELHAAPALRSIEVPVTVTAAWDSDYREYLRLAVGLRSKEEEIARLRGELLEDRLMAELHLEQLEAAGVILHWAAPALDTPAAAPALDTPAEEPPTIHRTQLRDRLMVWLATEPSEITFRAAFHASMVISSHPHRRQVTEVLSELGYTHTVGRGRIPTLFHKP